VASQSAAQLLAEIAEAQPPQLSGSLTWTANLGLSDLSTLEGAAGQSTGGSGPGTSGFDPLTLLSGSYEIDVWLDGAKAEHLALDLPSAEEVDLVRNGAEAWLWDSSTNTATHLVGAQAAGAAPTAPPSAPAGPGVDAPAAGLPLSQPRERQHLCHDGRRAVRGRPTRIPVDRGAEVGSR